MQSNFSKYRQLSDDMIEIENMFSTVNAGFWDPNSLDPQAETIVGDMDIINKKVPLLVNVNSSGKVEIIGELQKNNWFKFTDGTYAPVVVTTDPTQPWETTDKGYDIVIGWRKTIWMLGGEFDQNGNTLFGFFSNPTYYNGFLTKEVSPTGYCLDLPTYYKNALRCIYIKDTGGSTSIGQGSFFDVRRTNRAYPRTGVSQLSTMTQARARNIGDVQSSMPVCEGMGFHKLSHIYSRYIKYLRYDLHPVSYTHLTLPTT